MERIKYILMLVAVASGLAAAVALASPATQAIHDVALTDIQGPAGPILQGAIVTVNVTVSNQGTFRETIKLVLRDDTDNRNVATVFLTLTSGESLPIGLRWNTQGTSGGEHTLTATADAPDDAEPGNNSRSTATPTTVVGTEISVDGADAVFGRSVLQPNVDTIAVERQSLFVGNADATFGQSVLQPNADTIAVERQSFFVGNADASFGKGVLGPNVDTVVVDKQSLFVGNADALFRSRTTFRRPLPPDLNCDGTINIKDAVIILQHIVGRLPVIECQGIPLFSDQVAPPR